MADDSRHVASTRMVPALGLTTLMVLLTWGIVAVKQAIADFSRLTNGAITEEYSVGWLPTRHNGVKHLFTYHK